MAYEGFLTSREDRVSKGRSNTHEDPGTTSWDPSNIRGVVEILVTNIGQRVCRDLCTSRNDDLIRSGGVHIEVEGTNCLINDSKLTQDLPSNVVELTNQVEGSPRCCRQERH